MTHPAEKVTDILEYPPKKPINGWRVWRDHLTMVWHIEFYEDGHLCLNHIESTNYGARLRINYELREHVEFKSLKEDEARRKKIAIAEIFNEAEE